MKPYVAHYLESHQDHADKILATSRQFGGGEVWLSEMAARQFDPSISFYHTEKGVSMIGTPVCFWEPIDVQHLPTTVFIDVYFKSAQLNKAALLAFKGGTTIREPQTVRMAALNIANQELYQSLLKTAEKCTPAAAERLMRTNNKVLDDCIKHLTLGQSSTPAALAQNPEQSFRDLLNIERPSQEAWWWTAMMSTGKDLNNAYWWSGDGHDLLKTQPAQLSVEQIRMVGVTEFLDYSQPFEKEARLAMRIMRLSDNGSEVGYAKTCLEKGFTSTRLEELKKMYSKLPQSLKVGLQPRTLTPATPITRPKPNSNPQLRRAI